MKKVFFLIYSILYFSAFSQVEMQYNSNSNNLPKWVQLMYSNDVDEGVVIEAYTNFYKSNKFVKNKHTQYYKQNVLCCTESCSFVWFSGVNHTNKC